MTHALLPLQILNPSPARSYNYGGFPGTLGKDQYPNDSIPNLETTILVTYALVLSSPLPVKKTLDGLLYAGLAVMAALTVVVATILTKSKPERFNVALS